MSKNTPGPWNWVNSQTDEPFDFDAEWDGYGRPSLRTVAEKQKSTFMLPEWILDAEPMQHGNDVANARLIAAAPELLDALVGVLDAAENFYIEGAVNPDKCKDIQAARAAIAKANGETQ